MGPGSVRPDQKVTPIRTAWMCAWSRGSVSSRVCSMRWEVRRRFNNSVCWRSCNVTKHVDGTSARASTRRGPHVLCGLKWTVTWLILPVVICLSQRLSHACLSINKSILWNCEWLIKSVIVYLMVPCYMDNCGNSRANTCIKAPTSGRGVFIR